jgi:hypothetical protein
VLQRPHHLPTNGRHGCHWISVGQSRRDGRTQRRLTPLELERAPSGNWRSSIAGYSAPVETCIKDGLASQLRVVVLPKRAILGAVFLAEVGDVHRFVKAPQLTSSSWTGLTPSHHEADTTCSGGGPPGRGHGRWLWKPSSGQPHTQLATRPPLTVEPLTILPLATCRPTLRARLTSPGGWPRPLLRTCPLVPETAA